MSTHPLDDLNPKQREAVETVDGPLLIVAGPGSGKTRVITHRIAYLVTACGVAPYRIAAVTFTNKAAREMQARLFGRSEEDTASPLLDRAMRDQGLAVSTFHSFCARVLRRDGESLGLDRSFVIYDDSDQIGLLERAMKEVEVDPKSYSPRAVQSSISSAKSRLIGVDGFRARVENYADEVALRVYERYESLKSLAGAVDFDDLLMKTYLLLRDFPDVSDRYRSRYDYFMIDEFQDTNAAQYAIARQLSETHRNICVVGDPDQSIYSWRNADAGNILGFQNDYPEAKVVVLDESYRSTQTILDAARSVISANTGRIPNDLWTSKGAGEPICVFEGYDDQEEARFVLGEIENLTGGRRYGLGDVAVMYRVNAQSRVLEEECLRRGIPYQLVGGQKFYSRQEIKDLTAYLRLTANPHDDVSMSRVINTPTRGIGQRTRDAIARLARDTGSSTYGALESLQSSAAGRTVGLGSKALRALAAFKSLIDHLADESGRLDLIDLIKLTIERSGYERHLRQDEERGDERLENVQEYLAAAREFADLDGREALAAFLENVSLVSDVDELEEKTERVTLITLHQAKGLEFPVVFMVGMEEGLLPHARSMEDPAAVEEERRLFYVGITRAGERVYLLRAFRRTLWGRYETRIPSRFLVDVPRELIVSPDRRASDRAPRPAGRRGPARPREPNAGDTGQLRTGDKVRHDLFGDGIVTSAKPSTTDVELTVAFTEGHGVKRLLQSFAPLKKVN